MSISVTPIPRLTVLTTPSFTLGTTNSAGSAATAVASNSTLLAFDATVPAAAYASSPLAGSASVSARRDHVHSIPTTAPWQLVGSNTTEGSEDSSTASDLITVSSLSIPTANPVLVVCSFARAGGGTTSIPRIGVKINSTVVSEDQAFANSSSGPVSSFLTIWIGPRIAGYLYALWYEVVAHYDDGTLVKNIYVNETAAMPAAVITAISVRGSVSATPSEVTADNLAVYQLPI
jgi:hypothetical protein